MNRLLPLILIPVAALTLHAQTSATKRPPPAKAAAPSAQPFSVVEATIPEMRAAMEQGRVTSRELVHAVSDAHRACTRTSCTRRSR